MASRYDERYGIPPLRSKTVEHVLLPGGRQKLTIAQLEKRCLSRLTKLFATHAVWPASGYRDTWQVGDCSILVVETTVAPGAELYVQFWSEPGRPVDCEVSSANMNPGAKAFVATQARERLAEMGFKAPGGGNFARETQVSNIGDAKAAARDVLRIFHDALGYRGLTPLVARVTTAERSTRAVVHHRFNQVDAATILQHLGFDTRILEQGKRPVIQARQGDVSFIVILDVPAAGRGEFHCLDFVAPVGQVTDGAAAAWSEAVNRLNGSSRVARGWIDTGGSVLVGTSLHLLGGMTDDAIANAVNGWYQAVIQLRGGPPKARKGRQRRKAAEGAPELETEPASKSRPVVH
jgi:hypothetical protein